ncbi:hypothetical protein MNEG_10497 [Monoraphidium neglectum]|uniref:Uncharacterized protein n=1 Tax=Monoraphidium neglectum TaxID=145388 RepID=A0A0D2M1A2_9CHLO|nr:hypothetical protein MNEG_10497 [Monoraphidium neglectum]KIY97464.1 hypothetical protein MNEG_10497 [Monoraphidium neglectum]|eukprot:XP_013896484.1 hypothetical protein MNEG_10497 [Monoraphidium neglectum]
MFSLRFSGAFNWGLPKRPSQQRKQPRRVRATGSDSAPASTLSSRVGGFGGLAQAGLVAGAVAGAGSLGAQFVAAKQAEGRGAAAPEYDFVRVLRIAGFGALLYGPYQHALFSVLEWGLPAQSIANVLAKVAVSQVALAPAVLAFLYVWSLGGSEAKGDATALSQSVKNDLGPSTVDGWKVWVPAFGLTFLAVPPASQVLFTTLASVGFSGYESHQSTGDAAARAPTLSALAAAAAAKKAAAAAEAAASSAAAVAVPKEAPKANKNILGLSDNQVTVLITVAWIGACVALKKD